MNYIKKSIFLCLFFITGNLMAIFDTQVKQAVCPVSGAVKAESSVDEHGNITSTYHFPSRGGYLESYISRQEGVESYTKFVKYPAIPQNKNVWWRILARTVICSSSNVEQGS